MDITKAQSEFLQSKARVTLFKGGVGAGKTRILCHGAIHSAINNRRCAIISFSYKMLRDVIVPTLKEVLAELKLPYEYKKGDNNFVVCGSEILIRSADDPDSLRGMNLFDAYLDEACYMKDGSFDVIVGRTRESEDSQIKIATTPKGNRSWVAELEKMESTKVIVQSTLENPFLPQSYIDHLLSQYTGKFARQEIYAENVDFGSGIIDPNWFNVSQVSTDMTRKVRFWDLAVSIKKNADNSAGALVSKGDKITIHDIVVGKFEYPDLRKKIINTAYLDGKDVIIGIEEAGQQGGFIADLKRCRELDGFVIRALRPKGDKLNRALPWISRAELGDVNLVNGGWVVKFKDECADFSGDDSHAHDDMIDAVSGAYQMLSEGRARQFSAAYA